MAESQQWQEACKYAKENIEKPDAFSNNVLWTDNKKLNFLATTKEGIFWRKKDEAFVEKNTLPTVKHGGGFIIVWAV